MAIRIVLLFLSFLNGAYMLIDGLHVVIKGKYIGPEKPGPWANVLYKLDVDVFKLGPLFMLLGILWLAFMIGFWLGYSWAYPLGFFIAILTLWYLPVGTVTSIIIFILLYITKSQAGF